MHHYAAVDNGVFPRDSPVAPDRYAREYLRGAGYDAMAVRKGAPYNLVITNTLVTDNIKSDLFLRGITLFKL
jgi:hypothetical protein